MKQEKPIHEPPVSFVVFDSTGRIVSKGIVPASMLALQGVNIVTGDYQPDTHYIDTRRKVAVTKPVRPTEWHEFDYSSKTWVMNEQRARDAMRSERLRRLAASDWTQLPDVPLETKQAWATYRQALRDVTQQPGFPLRVKWPAAPN